MSSKLNEKGERKRDQELVLVSRHPLFSAHEHYFPSRKVKDSCHCGSPSAQFSNFPKIPTPTQPRTPIFHRTRSVPSSWFSVLSFLHPLYPLPATCSLLLTSPPRYIPISILQPIPLTLGGTHVRRLERRSRRRPTPSRRRR